MNREASSDKWRAVGMLVDKAPANASPQGRSSPLQKAIRSGLGRADARNGSRRCSHESLPRQCVDRMTELRLSSPPRTPHLRGCATRTGGART